MRRAHVLIPLFCVVAVLSAPAIASSADAVPECFPPGSPEIPDGKVASDTDMIAAQQRMKLFRESAEVYAACMDDRFKRFAPRVPQRRRERWVKEREKLAESVQTATQRFNESVRAYKARREGGGASQPPQLEPGPKKNEKPLPG